MTSSNMHHWSLLAHDTDITDVRVTRSKLRLRRADSAVLQEARSTRVTTLQTRSRLTCCTDALCNLPAAGEDVVQALTCS